MNDSSPYQLSSEKENGKREFNKRRNTRTHKRGCRGKKSLRIVGQWNRDHVSIPPQFSSLFNMAK
jgi:hypothetical protein